MPSAIRVLYVDDEPGLLNIGKLFLEREGAFAVDIRRSVSEALELLNTEHYDTIISDYQMPDIDGIEFLKKLKTLGNTTPFIIFTGKGREEVVIEAINSGADFYLQKGGEPKAQFAELAHKIKTAVSRQRTENQARDTERRLYDIINFLPDATFAIDNDGRVIAWNKAIEEMTGVPATDMLGKGDYEYAIPFYEVRRPILIDLVSIPNEELSQGTYAIVKKEGDLLIAETTLPRPLGRYSVLHGKASLLYNNQGEVIGAIESIRDITEQKRAEIELIRKNDELNASYEQIAAAEEEMRAQLTELKQTQQNIQESEEKYRTLVEHCMDAVFIAQDGCIAAVNPAFSSMTGYSEEELIGQPLTMPIAPEDREMVLSRHKRRLAGHNEPNNYEFSMVHKDKQARLRVIMSVGAGKYQGRSATIGTIHDVTMERNREDLLRESEMRFHQLSNASDDGLVMHKQGIIQEVNTSACNLFDYSHDELIGMDVLDLTAPGSKDIVREKIQMLSEAPYEMEGLKKDKSRFFGTFHSRNITFKNQQVRLTSVRDITESRRSEEALKHQSETLSILNGIIITANKADTLPGLLSGILEESLRLMDFDAGGIYLVNHSTRTADVVQSKNLPHEFLVKIQTVPIDKNPYDMVFIRKEPIFTENYAKINPDSSKKFGFQSAAIVPLLAKGEAIGAMNLTSTKRYIISEEEKQTLISIGSELGSTLERMIAEVDAKKASKNLETLFNSIDEMVFVLDMGGNILAINDTVQKRLLYTPEELTGTNVLLLHVPERRDEALQIVQGMIAGTIDSCPVPVVSKDGTRIDVETKVTRALWNDQEVLIGVTRDITERKCAEEALRESEAKLQLALFGSETGMWELDIPSMAGIIDDRAADILGYQKNSIGSRSIDWDELSHPDDVPLIQKRLADYLDGRTTIFESEHRMRDVSGEWVWVLGRGKITHKSQDGSSFRISGTLHNITDRKHVELELVAAQKDLKEAHRLAHIGTFDWDLGTDTVTWSEQLFNISGRDPSLGAPAYADLPAYYSNASWDLLSGAVTGSLSTGDPFNLELEMIRSDGSKRWTNNFGGVKRNEMGKIIGFYGTVQDITEWKRVEVALEKAQEKYTKAFLASPDAIILTDMETGRFVEVNDTTSRIYGYSRDEMIGKSAVELGIWLRNEDRDDFISQLRINGRVEGYETIGRHKFGKLFNGSISADIIKIGDRVHLISIIRDITKRKIVEEALRESEARFRKILEKAPLPLCYVNTDGVITFRNERFVQIFGYTAEDVPTLTKWWQQAYPDAHYRQWVTTTWDAALQRATENGIDIRPVEYRVTCKSGEERIIEITGITLGDDFLATFIDLTERKRTEEKLQETNEYLNNLIEYANAPIIVWDSGYVITRFNHAFEDLAFLPEQEVIGQRLDILFPKESRDASFLQIKKTILVSNPKTGVIYIT